jgi:hypothetical protein
MGESSSVEPSLSTLIIGFPLTMDKLPDVNPKFLFKYLSRFELLTDFSVILGWVSWSSNAQTVLKVRLNHIKYDINAINFLVMRIPPI